MVMLQKRVAKIGGNEYPTVQALKLTRSQLILNAETYHHWLILYALRHYSVSIDTIPRLHC